MRTIKFRAWSGTRMVYDVELYKSGEAHWRDGQYSVHQSSSIVMQFTGLHDKNGKEIYEGDLLSHKNWDNKPFEVEWRMNHGSHAVGYVYGFYMPDQSEEPGKWEVIGNIYENPLLIQK